MVQEIAGQKPGGSPGGPPHPEVVQEDCGESGPVASHVSMIPVCTVTPYTSSAEEGLEVKTLRASPAAGITRLRF